MAALFRTARFSGSEAGHRCLGHVSNTEPLVLDWQDRHSLTRIVHLLVVLAVRRCWRVVGIVVLGHLLRHAGRGLPGVPGWLVADRRQLDGARAGVRRRGLGSLGHGLRVSAAVLRGSGASLALALLLGESSLAGLFLLLLSLPLPADIFELWIGKATS